MFYTFLLENGPVPSQKTFLYLFTEKLEGLENTSGGLMEAEPH